MDMGENLDSSSAKRSTGGLLENSQKLKNGPYNLFFIFPYVLGLSNGLHRIWFASGPVGRILV